MDNANIFLYVLYSYVYFYTVLIYYLLKVKMDGNNWEDNPDRQILDLAGVKTQHDERGPSYDDDK